MDKYNIFANCYDQLMYDVDYKGVCDYVLSLAAERGIQPPGLAVDLGCGTGKTCLYLAEAGFDMIGVDYAADMLTVARDTIAAAGKNVLLLHQDMTDFELYGTVALATCLTDGINHVTDSRKLKRMFYWVHNYLDFDGVFIFDINSEEKLAKEMGNQVFYQVSEEVSYLWQCQYHTKRKIATFDLTFFIQEPNGLYRKEETVIKERAYSVKELTEWLKEAGFVRIQHHRKKNRIYFVCQREGA